MRGAYLAYPHLFFVYVLQDWTQFIKISHRSLAAPLC